MSGGTCPTLAPTPSLTLPSTLTDNNNNNNNTNTNNNNSQTTVMTMTQQQSSLLEEQQTSINVIGETLVGQSDSPMLQISDETNLWMYIAIGIGGFCW